MSFDGPPNAFSRSSVRSFRCGLPSMHSFRSPCNAAAAACLPAATASFFGTTVLRSLTPYRGTVCFGPAISMAGGHCPEPPRCLAPRQSGSSPGCCQVVRERIGRFAETVCRPGYAPTAAESATWRTVPCAVHLPARRDTIAPWHVGRGVPRPGRARPGRRPGCPEARPAARTTGCPVDGRSAAVYAELLRRAQNMPWTSGWPRRGRLGRHPSAVHCTRIISASPAQSS